MKKIGILGFLALLCFSSSAWATNGIQLAGIGAYGTSMGGAVTAAPFDTTTAVTNPAGLTKIGTRADFNFEMFMPKRNVDFTGAGGAKTEGGTNSYLIPSIGCSAPIDDESTLFFGGGMFVVSGMGVDYDTINTTYLQASGGVNGPLMKGRMYSQYQFWKMAPTLAKKFNDKLSVGLALNIDYQQMAYKNWFTQSASGSPYLSAMGVDLSTPSGAMGFGFTVGAIYDMSDTITVGASYASKQTFADMEYRLMKGNVTNSVGTTQYMSTDSTYKWTGMDAPQQYSLGAAVKATPELTVTLDYKWINYSDTFKTQHLTGTFTDFSGAAIASTSMPLNFGWKDINVYALGLQYQVGDSGWIRAGYNQGDSPIDNAAVDSNWAFPAIAKTHFMLGGTKNIGTHWQVAFAYENVANETMTGASGAKISLAETSYTLGLSYLFR